MWGVTNLKRYLLFIISFALLYTVYQLGSGIILTTFYTPDIYSPGSQEIVPVQAFYSPLLEIFLTASIAYFISQKTSRTQKEKTI